MLSHVGIAIATFTITNIDDLIILSLYFARGNYPVKSIVGGQYLGITTLIAISLVGLWLGQIIEPHWISLLGIIPFSIGVKGLMAEKKDEAHVTEQSDSRFAVLNVAAVTIANGGDNIGVYGPLFATITISDFYIYLTTFMVLTSVWCLLGFYFAKHPMVRRIFIRF